MWINNLNSVGKSSAVRAKSESNGEDNEKEGKEKTAKRKVKNISGQYEIVSGRVVAQEPEPDKPKEKSVLIYRKLSSNAVQFDEKGKKIKGEGAESASK